MLEKAYDPSQVEDRIYALWEESGAFKADPHSEKEPFTISMPPPNATGDLHLGHAMFLAIQDAFIRHARMEGKEALWVPGTDHAAIATESVVIKNLQKGGMADPRVTLGREGLVEKIKEFVEGSKNTIRGQMRKMGSSCDWNRERYTMDDGLNRVVNDVFARMYRDGLIYRGHRIVNWDPKMQTTVSDMEMEYVEETIPFYTFQYGPFQIATARPETKFGDKYVVMHPDDERYAQYKHGDTFECEWINGPITATIIKDKAIDPEFGTGVMTITPWHDATDFEIAERHDLEKQQIIGFDGKLLDVAGEFAGLKIADARPKIVEKLKEKGLLVKTEENYVHNVAVSYRGKGPIEPQIKEQWFIDVNKAVVPWNRRQLSLKEIMQEVVRNGEIKIIPERFEKTYFQWVDNLRDWCISRQIWWGHRVPVWYRASGESYDMHVGLSAPDGDGWEQDPDTLDTWFSSALWTWSTLLDPALALDPAATFEELLKNSPDFQKFHPTTVMETGYDILPFWVIRMILMTTYATGQIPFETVYLHGMVRTREGAKMSKSHPETMIDPLDIIPRYGADALRLSLVVGQSPGADTKMYEEKIAGYRNFVNKLWNATRFILLQCEAAGVDPQGLKLFQEQQLSLADEALLAELQALTRDVTEAVKAYRLSEAGERIYGFTWDFFCDWYLEVSKAVEPDENGKTDANLPLLIHALRTLLTLLHPFAPFVTEEIWAHVKPRDAGLLIREAWPQVDVAFDRAEPREQFKLVTEVITAVRKLRQEHGVPLDANVSVTLVSDQTQVLWDLKRPILKLARLQELNFASKAPEGEVASVFLSGAEVHMPLEGLIDTAKERERLEKERESLEKYAAGIRAKLDNADFVAKAPEKLVANQKAKLAETEEKLGKVRERLGQLS